MILEFRLFLFQVVKGPGNYANAFSFAVSNH
jgi:hypothetical protein